MASEKRAPGSRPAVDLGIPETVVDILIDHLAVDEAEMTMDSTLIEDLGADSLDIVEVAMAFEEAYGLGVINDGFIEVWETAPLSRILADLKRMGAKV